MPVARVHVFRVLISTMLAMVTVMLMDMAQGAFFGYYMCAQPLVAFIF